MENLKDFYKNKKVFITGHTGFKGSWLCQILLNLGADVYGYALEPENKSLYNILKLGSKINSVYGDIRDLKKLKDVILNVNPDIIIHMAAQPLVLESYSNPVYTYDTNVMGTVNILESLRCLSNTKSFLNVTTDKVYENKEWVWGYRENENLCGYDPYSNSKSCSELVTYSYKNSFFSSVEAVAISTARSGNVIGGGDFSANRIIPDCIKSAINNEPIFVRNPNSVRPYQHVMECLYGYLLLSMKQYEDKNFEGAYNFGPNESDCVTTGTLATLFCDIWGDNLKWYTENSNLPHEAQFLKLDCSKSKNMLYWNPIWNIIDSLKKIIEWTKTYYSNGDIENITNLQIREFFSL